MNYNKNKTYVKKSDYYSFLTKLVKWWKEVVFHVFDSAMVNTTNKKNRKNPTEAILQGG
jgi:hypothetical protein